MHGVEVRRSVKLAAVEPPNENRSGKLVNRLKGQLLVRRWSLGGKKFSEQWDLLGEEMVVSFERLPRWTGKEGCLRQIICRGRFRVRVVGVD